MRKLDTPYKLGDDYFIDSKLNVPFYQVPLWLDSDSSFIKESSTHLDPIVCIGIFRKTKSDCVDFFTYKLDKEESKRNYKPRIKRD